MGKTVPGLVGATGGSVREPVSKSVLESQVLPVCGVSDHTTGNGER